MSSSNGYNETTPADRLKDLKKDVDANKAGNTSDQQFTPEYVLPLDDGVNFSDAVIVDANRKNVADGVNFSDSVSLTGYNSGGFQICNEAGGGVGVTQAARAGFCDIGDEQGDISRP